MESQLTGQKIFSRFKQKNARSYFSRNFTSTFVQSIFLLTCADTFTKSCSKNFKTRFERKIVTLFYRRSGRAIGLTIVNSTFSFDFLAFTVPRT